MEKSVLISFVSCIFLVFLNYGLLGLFLKECTDRELGYTYIRAVLARTSCFVWQQENKMTLRHLLSSPFSQQEL